MMGSSVDFAKLKKEYKGSIARQYYLVIIRLN